MFGKDFRTISWGWEGANMKQLDVIFGRPLTQRRIRHQLRRVGHALFAAKRHDLVAMGVQLIVSVQYIFVIRSTTEKNS